MPVVESPKHSQNKLPKHTPCGTHFKEYINFKLQDTMTRDKFASARKKLGKTQKALAKLLGVSLKAVQSYEQGWRTVPLHVERQIYFLIVNKRQQDQVKRKDCWTQKKCTLKKDCPAWEFQAGHLCWFLNGTQCECTAEKDLKHKMEVCRECDVLSSLL